MIDTMTDKPLQVDGGSYPYIMLPLSQLDTVRALLDANKISYWVDEEALSVDGEPEVIWINLSRKTDPKEVQQLLDSVP